MSCGGASPSGTFPTGGANSATVAVTEDNAFVVIGDVFGEPIGLSFGAAKPIAAKPLHSGNINQTANKITSDGQTFTHNVANDDDD